VSQFERDRRFFCLWDRRRIIRLELCDQFDRLGYGYLVIAGMLYWSVKRGMRLTGFSFRELMTNANDDLTIKYFDCFAKGSADQGGEGEAVKNKKADDTGYAEPATGNA